MNVGNNGTFEMVSTAPMEVRDYYILLYVGALDVPESYGPSGRPTGGEGDLYEPFAIYVTNDDVTPPMIIPQLPGDSTAYGWYRNDVPVEWTVIDEVSALTTRDCSVFTVTVDGVHSFTCEATSVGGTATKTITIKRDVVPPRLSPTVLPAEGYVGQTIIVSPNATDDRSQIASASCDPVSTSTTARSPSNAPRPTSGQRLMSPFDAEMLVAEIVRHLAAALISVAAGKNGQNAR